MSAIATAHVTNMEFDIGKPNKVPISPAFWEMPCSASPCSAVLALCRATNPAENPSPGRLKTHTSSKMTLSNRIAKSERSTKTQHHRQTKRTDYEPEAGRKCMIKGHSTR